MAGRRREKPENRSLPRGIERLPSGLYRARVRTRGADTSETFATVADADHWITKVKRDIDTGIWNPNLAAERVTLGDALARYIKDELPLKRGQRGESSILRILSAEPEAKLKLAAITGNTIERMRDRWLRAGYSPGTLHRRFHTLSHVFTKAIGWWQLTTMPNPVRGVELPPEAPGRARRISADELSAIIAAGGNTAHLAAFVPIAIAIAARLSEIIGLRWRDVNFRRATIFFPKTKNGPPRTIPMPLAAQSPLLALQAVAPSDDPDSRVFAGWANSDSAKQAFARAVKRARGLYVKECKAKHQRPNHDYLTGIHEHDLRHEAISRLALVLGIHEMKAVSGHKTLRMLDRYYHPKPEEIAVKLRAAGL